ncbi:MAG TPA: FUSC family protein [Trebonia sp.]
MRERLLRPGPSLSSAIGGARRRVADAGWCLVETPVAAGLAWFIAHTLLGHHQPFFAPTAAAISLSKDKVLRAQHAVQLIVGATLGIGVGTAVKAMTGSTPGAPGSAVITVTVLLAFAAALVVGRGFFGEGVLFVNQATTAAILMIAVAGSATGSERLTDALVGGGVTLVITVVLFPAAPLPLIGDASRQVLGALGDTVARLAELADTAQAPDPEWVFAAGQRIQSRLTRLDQARSAARQVAGFAPRRWPQRTEVRRSAERAASLYPLAANVLSLARASSGGPAVRQPQSSALSDALGALTSAFTVLAEGRDASAAQAVRHAARVRTLVTGTARAGDPRSQLVAGLVEECADDVLRLAGGAPRLADGSREVRSGTRR